MINEKATLPKLVDVDGNSIILGYTSINQYRIYMHTILVIPVDGYTWIHTRLYLLQERLHPRFSPATRQTGESVSSVSAKSGTLCHKGNNGSRKDLAFTVASI